MSARDGLAAKDAAFVKARAFVPGNIFEAFRRDVPPLVYGHGAANEARAVFFADLLDAATPTLMRLDALGDQLDSLAADLSRAPAGSPEREGLHSVLFGLLQGLRCCQVLTPEQTEAFTARMRQGIAEGWL